jgi:hypothetical protein
VRTRRVVERRPRAAAKRAGAGRAAKPSPRELEDELHVRRKALADLMHSEVLGQGDVARAFRQITETAADVLAVDRASVWRLVDDGAAIECIDLFERSGKRHSAGVRIRAADVPRYFAALQRERAIRAHDARKDARTSEFREGYLEPLGITSMLDAPVFLRGKMVGVVCHEHTGKPRRWKLHEELLAGSFADFVAVVLETAAWREAEDELRLERDALETKVAERTRDLSESGRTSARSSTSRRSRWWSRGCATTRSRWRTGARPRCSRCRCRRSRDAPRPSTGSTRPTASATSSA